jgi:hypothetical protein
MDKVKRVDASEHMTESRRDATAKFHERMAETFKRMGRERDALSAEDAARRVRQSQ